MQKHSNLAIVTGSILAFAAWELVDHMVLMGLPVFTEHAISFLAESALAVTAIFLVARAREAENAASLRADQMVAVVAEALSSEDSQESPVKGVLDALEEIREQTADSPETQGTVLRAEKNARRIQSVSRYLGQLVSSKATGNC